MCAHPIENPSKRPYCRQALLGLRTWAPALLLVLAACSPLSRTLLDTEGGSARFAGEWNYTERCNQGHAVTLSLRQSGSEVTGSWSEGTRVSGSDGLLIGTVRGDRLLVRYCGNDKAAGYLLCPKYEDDYDYFVREETLLFRYRRSGSSYRRDIALARASAEGAETSKPQECMWDNKVE